MKKPNFFIVGAPKCGTTAMNDYLHQHPDIFMAVKELHYFGRDLKTKQELPEPDYLQHFREAGQEQVVGEASVWYLYSQTAAEEIKRFSPGAKILIMLRNPVQVLHSMHSQHIYDGNEDVADFETAINLDEERKQGRHLPGSVDFFALPPYKESVLFYAQVKRYLDTFGPKNVKVVLYDDFRASPEATVREVLRFLEVDPQLAIDYRVINANKQVQWLALHRLVKYPAPGLKKLVRALLPFRSVRHSIMAGLLRRNIRIQKREQMDARLNARLRAGLAEDIIALGNLINRDLSAWLR